MSSGKIKFIDEIEINSKRVLLRVDFNISLVNGLTISDDARIRKSIPTIKYLLKKANRVILVSHLGRPLKRDPKYSLKIVVRRLQELLPANTITLVDDFLSEDGKKQIKNQKNNQILLLENIRFYPQEKANAQDFARQLATLGDLYVNDAFGAFHRTDASIVSVPKFSPSYGGFLLKSEIKMISKVFKNPEKPVVAILGGAKVSTKIKLIEGLMDIVDLFLVGGGIANTFLCTQGINIGKSYCDYYETKAARRLLQIAAQKNRTILLPQDVKIGNPNDGQNAGKVIKVEDIPNGGVILDIGPQTQASFGSIITKAKTIIWNGPIGYYENPNFKQGTDFIYSAISQNRQAFSVVGGGDTLSTVSKDENLEKIGHVSTGGGAMLEFIGQKTLPGIEALKSSQQTSLA